MKIVQGDLLSVEKGVIAQQVNCRGVMTDPIGAAIRVRYPVVYERYAGICGKLPPKGLFGAVQEIPVSSDLVVANIFTQMDCDAGGAGGLAFTDLPELSECLRHICETHPYEKVYIPFGIASSDEAEWSVVSSRLRDVPVIAVKPPA